MSDAFLASSSSPFGSNTIFLGNDNYTVTGTLGSGYTVKVASGQTGGEVAFAIYAQVSDAPPEANGFVTGAFSLNSATVGAAAKLHGDIYMEADSRQTGLFYTSSPGSTGAQLAQSYAGSDMSGDLGVGNPTVTLDVTNKVYAVTGGNSSSSAQTLYGQFDDTGLVGSTNANMHVGPGATFTTSGNGNQTPGGGVNNSSYPATALAPGLSGWTTTNGIGTTAFPGAGYFLLGYGAYDFGDQSLNGTPGASTQKAIINLTPILGNSNQAYADWYSGATYFMGSGKTASSWSGGTYQNGFTTSDTVTAGDAITIQYTGGPVSLTAGSATVSGLTIAGGVTRMMKNTGIGVSGTLTSTTGPTTTYDNIVWSATGSTGFGSLNSGTLTSDNATTQTVSGTFTAGATLGPASFTLGATGVNATSGDTGLAGISPAAGLPGSINVVADRVLTVPSPASIPTNVLLGGSLVLGISGDPAPDTQATNPVVTALSGAAGSVTLKGVAGTFSALNTVQYVVSAPFNTAGSVTGGNLDLGVVGILAKESASSVSGAQTLGGGSSLVVTIPTINVGGAATNGTGYGAALVAQLVPGQVISSSNALSSTTPATGGNLGSTATILALSSTGNSTVSMQWRQRTSQETAPSAILPLGIPYLASDVVNLTTPSDSSKSSPYVLPFALQMTFNPALVTSPALLGADGLLYLAAKDSVGNWKVATWLDDGDGSVVAAHASDLKNFDGSWSAFLAKATADGYTGNLSTLVGGYGYDPTGGVVYAVVDHNSDFAASPEPGTLALLFGAGLGWLLWRRRKAVAK
jgi:hypothetical protein